MDIAIPNSQNTMESKYTDRRLSSALWAINEAEILAMIVSTIGPINNTRNVTLLTLNTSVTYRLHRHMQTAVIIIEIIY
jgi:1,2-phenylacetyl-CoA epoxidase PaaB subunit